MKKQMSGAQCPKNYGFLRIIAVSVILLLFAMLFISPAVASTATPTYSIEVKSEGGGTLTAHATQLLPGYPVVLDPKPNSGYILKEWKISPEGYDEYIEIHYDSSNDNYWFTMINTAYRITITAVFVKDEPPTTYSVTTTTEGNGVVSVISVPNPPTAGTKVSLLATPLSGYIFKEWQVVSGDVTIADDNTFIMPDSDVTIKAVFEADTSVTPETTHSVTVITEGDGIVSVISIPNPPTTGTEVSLLATPLSGYIFKEW